jgi:hypothetical protein
VGLADLMILHRNLSPGAFGGSPAAVPEPSTPLLAGTALLFAASVAQHRRRK